MWWNREKMEKKTRLAGAVAIAIVLMIAFSGVAAASWLAEFTPENQTVKTATKIVDWKSSSKNLFDNPTLAFGKVATDFNRNFNVHTGTGYTSKWNELGLLPTASSKKMNAYGRLLATDVQATAITKVGMTDKPVFNYEIDAGGSNDGSTAEGRISAGMSVYVARDSRLSYEERSTASGSFQFHKVMSYTSKITTP
jgi:hypothetical protein